MSHSPADDPHAPLLPAPVTQAQAQSLASPSRSRLAARRYLPPSPLSLGLGSDGAVTPTSAGEGAGMSEKGRGKQRAPPAPSSSAMLDEDNGRGGSLSPLREKFGLLGLVLAQEGLERGRGGAGDAVDGGSRPRPKPKPKERRGRNVTIIFSNESSGMGNLELWVEDGESVGSVKDQIRALRPSLAALSLRLIHAGRLLTDGIMLLPWLRALEERVRRQASSIGGDVESVLKEVGLAEDDNDDADAGAIAGTGRGKGQGAARPEERVWLHCNVGGVEARPRKGPAKAGAAGTGADGEPGQGDGEGAGEGEDGQGEDQGGSRRRGFDVLLDAGLSAADVAAMRRQFYESRGEEVPEGMDQGDLNDEHARALEEQWIEGDLTAETATTTQEGLYTSIMHGLLAGFLFPIMPWLFFREPPVPNFFDAEAEAAAQAHAVDADETPVSSHVARNPAVGGEMVLGVVFGKRMQMGIFLGTIMNLCFGALRFLN